MPSFRNLFALSMAVSGIVACSATPSSQAHAPAAETMQAQPTATRPPSGASGKLAPEMVGKVSPVPAFMGQGGRGTKRWTIDIHSEGEMRHRVDLIWTQTHRRLQGSVFYRDAPTPSTHGAPIALDGSLDTAKGPRKVRIDILTETCTDETKTAYPQRVRITLQDQPIMDGCGELAVY